MRLLIFVLFATTVFAQSANVIDLEPSDAVRAQKAWEALQKAQSEWNAVKTSFEKRYLEAGPDESYSNCLNGSFHIKSGWVCGEMEFTRDFKHIVPKQLEPTVTYPGGCFSFGAARQF